MEDCGVALYCDMHAHSRKHNIFIYGCENMKRHPDRRLLEQVFPLMLHKNVADKFSFENCKFRVQKNKEGTGRIVVWVLGITNSYTLEASFAGSTLGGRAGTHFSTMVSAVSYFVNINKYQYSYLFTHVQDYEHLGRAFCETLMDYYDDNPLKVNKTLTNLKQIRKTERKARKALKAQKMAELLIEQEKQRQLDLKFEEIAEREKLKKIDPFSIRDQFNWDELQENLNDNSIDGSDDENCDNDENIEPT